MASSEVDREEGHTLAVRPLLVAAGAFAVGAAAGRGAPVAWAAAIAGLSALLAMFSALHRRAWSVGLLAGAAMASGVAVAGLDTPADSELATALGVGPKAWLVVEGVVAAAPERLPDATRLVVDLAGARVAAELATPLVPVQGRARIFVPGGRACGAAGDRIRLLARLAAPEPAASLGARSADVLLDRGIALTGVARSAEDCVVVVPRERAGVGLEGARDAVHRAIEARVAEPEAAVVRAFATGDQTGVPREIADAFAASGLAHLLAVSGLNLAIVAGLFLVAVERLLRRSEVVALGPGARRVAAIVAVPFVVAYTMLVGASPSAVRAAVMIGVLLAAHVVGRTRDAWSALAFAALVMIAWDPSALRDPSFQLSFVAVASLLVVHPALAELGARTLTRVAPSRGWPRWARWPAEVALASAAATLGTAPIVALHFQRLSLAGLVANVPAHPLASFVLVPLSLVGGLAGAAADAWAPAARVLEPIASAILAIAGWTASLLTALAAASAAVPGASLVVPAPNVIELSLYFVALIATVLVVRRVRFARGVALAAAITLVAEVGALALARHFDDTLRVVFLPVGQGDGIVVELPRGRVMVIDTGPGGRGPGTSAVERVIVPYLRARRIGRVDRVVLTHPHADHAGGLAALAASVEVGEVWWNGDVREGPPGLAALAAELGARRVDAPLGAETNDGVTIEVLGPARAPTRYDEVNDGSIVLRVAYGSRAFVLGGDAEAEAEAELVARGGLRADVLKAGHHGSRSSTTEAFLAAVAPAHVVLCLGKDNSFGFPHREVSERLARAGVHVWRTDLDGQVTFSTDGVHLDVAPFLDRARGAVDER